MRFTNVFLVGLVVAALVGCDSHVATSPASSGPPVAVKTETMAPPPSPPSRKMQTNARKAAAQFYSLYLSGQFAASWDLLAPAAKRQIRRSTWVEVHNGCLLDNTGKTGVVKSVTVFGHAAFVAEAITAGSSTPRTIEAVFDYTDDLWGYSPGDLGIYKHGSVSADIAAAKALGYCVGWKNSML